MSEQDPNQKEEDKSKLPEGGKSEDAELEDLFKDEEAPEGETLEDKVARLEAQDEARRKGVAKFFSEKGRKEKEAKKVTEKPKETPNQSSDDVTELFLESKPEAALVKDDLQMLADAKYDGSIIKAWKNEAWLQEKAKSLSEAEVAKGKIQPPSNQTASIADMASVAKMGDDEQAAAIRKMSDKDYAKWQEYQRNHSNKSGVLAL